MRPRRQPAWIFAVTVVLCFIISANLSAQHGPAPTAPTPLSPTTVRADLVTFREQFIATEASFTAATRTAANARLAALERAADTVQRAYLELEIARIVALADNGHTNSASSVRSAHFNRVGLRMSPFGEDFYVLVAHSSVKDLLGARLVAIDDRPVAQLRAAARTLAGGTDAWRDRNAPLFLESPQQLHTLGLSASNDRATYRFQLLDGRTVNRELSANPPDAGGAGGSSRWMFPETVAPFSGVLVSLLTADNAPWALREPETRFRFRDAPEIDGVVIEMRQVIDAPNMRILSFLAQMDTLLRTRRPINVVLDLRMNGGGNLNLARGFVQSLPTLVPGRVFVLTSPNTFSAAISTTGYLKQAAPDRVTIVGETVGDRLMFWAEGPPVTLPNTGIVIGHTKERHDYATGCAGYTDCHGNVVRNPIRVSTFAPDLQAPWTIESYRAGIDPGIAAVVGALKR